MNGKAKFMHRSRCFLASSLPSIGRFALMNGLSHWNKRRGQSEQCGGAGARCAACGIGLAKNKCGREFAQAHQILSHSLRHPPSQTQALDFPGSRTSRHAANSNDVCSAAGVIRLHGISPRQAADRRQRCMCVRSYGKLLPKSSGIFSPRTSRPPGLDESAAGSRARQERKKSYSREVVAHSGRVKFQRCSTATKTWRAAAAHGWNRSCRTCDTKASVSSSL